MKANVFVKKYGWEYAKHTLTDDAPMVMDLNYTDLKRLVESCELVESCGGIKEITREKIRAWELNMSRTYELLRKAIADVESCK